MQEKDSSEYTINFKALFQVLWKEKLLILLITSLFIFVGAWYAFTAQEQFISEGKILPELQGKNSKLGGLAGLASMAGVDISSIDATDAIRPDLYPDVLKSTPFFLALFNEKITTRTGKLIPFEEFYHNSIEGGEKIKEESLQKPQVKESGFLVLNRLTESRIKGLRNRIQVSIDKKSGLITIAVKMPDPVVAANVARFSMIYLTNYVTEYRLGKVQKDLEFLEGRLNLAQGKFYTNQEKKAKYSDQFQLPTIRLQSADIQRERIESEYRLSSSFYNELLKKHEEAKLKVQQETPVFQVLEPPIVPTLKSEPKKVYILLASLILGGFISLFIVALKNGNYKKFLPN